MSSQQQGTYDFSFETDNVYGHALNYCCVKFMGLGPGEIHLDIGCGYGRIGEKIQSELGQIYVGVDGSKDGLGTSRNPQIRDP